MRINRPFDRPARITFSAPTDDESDDDDGPF